MAIKKRTTGSRRMTARKALSISLQEIADAQREILTEMRAGFRDLAQTLGGRIDALDSELKSFRKETRHNFATFIVNHDALEKRVSHLEDKVGV